MQPMQLNDQTIDTPPRDAASVVLLRDSAEGLQTLLLRRHGNAAVLGGAWVFPGGKVDAQDAAAAMLAQLDRPASALHARLGEPALAPEAAAALFVAAAREAAEESGLLFLQRQGQERAERHASACARLRGGEPLAALLAEYGALLDTDALHPWTRWITPRRPAVMTKRFDTRFFMAVAPPEQAVQQDDYEVTEARWMTPRAALRQYQAGQIELAPPQVYSLLQLTLYRSAAQALQDAASRLPPLIAPESLDEDGQRVLVYAGDAAHPQRTRLLPAPLPTRLVWRAPCFEPPEGLGPWLA